MGSAFYTFDEAIGRLGKSKRSIYLYIKRGLLRKTIKDGKSLLFKDEVEQLAIERNSEYPPMTGKAFTHMQARLQKLEDEMRMVKHVLEIRDCPPLRPDPNMARGLFTAARTYRVVEDKDRFWNPEFIEKWSDIFERIDEETLEAISRAANDDQAWIEIFRFCSSLTSFCWKKDKERPSLEWQTRAMRLEECKKKLRSIIITWVEMGLGKAPEVLLNTLESGKESLIRKITAKA